MRAAEWREIKALVDFTLCSDLAAIHEHRRYLHDQLTWLEIALQVRANRVVGSAVEAALSGPTSANGGRQGRS